ncbi:MAG: MerR family transcriptional regulator [Proteobacteria bacterium]|nr:MerR family transcriptional regulator [Pseudomonadota bacterium]
MDQLLDITEVVRRTGLTSRALRFYEARGLLRPLRAWSGRRAYGPAELERINAILALKRAGFSLAAIGGMLEQRRTDFARLVAAQIEDLDARAAELAETRLLLRSIQSRIDRREPIDVATLCSLIRRGNVMEHEEQDKWKAISDRYMSEAEKADFAASYPQMAADFNQQDYAVRWKDLGSRIEAALPLDPASEQARGFLAEWKVLLEPFTRVATPAMQAASTRMYQNMGEWEGQADPGFSHKVFLFIQEVSRAQG